MSWGKVPGQAPRWEEYSVFVIHRFCTREFAHSLQHMCNSQIMAHGAFEVILRHEHSSENFVTQGVHSQWRWNKCSAFLFQLLYCKQEFFLQCFYVFALFPSWFMILLYGTTPKTVLRSCPVFPSLRKLWCALQRKYMCGINFIQVWIIVLLTMSSMLMTQQCSAFRKKEAEICPFVCKMFQKVLK